MNKYYLPHILSLSLGIMLFIAGCQNQAQNNPYRQQDKQANIRYATFTERPRTLDPARSYSSNEYTFISQIYEPPLQYHYLLRPYQLVPLTAQAVPKPIYLNKAGKQLPADPPAKDVAYSVYTIKIKPGIYYQPHPALAKDKKNHYIYHNLSSRQVRTINTLGDFTKTGSRELTAADYVYQIKRLAHPALNSPIASLMSRRIVGFKTFKQELAKAYKQLKQRQPDNPFLDLRQHPLVGVKAIDRYTYQITLKGKYPQFVYWLAMPFFAPMPWEADRFYSQPGLKQNNITFDWFPIGTGPYMLTKNNPNRQMVLAKNPNFHGEKYPSEGEAGDKAKGLLQDAGKKLPFVSKVIFLLEKESLPTWNKFLQGYYDQSAISSDSFDQAIQVDHSGKMELTPELKAKGIRLYSSVEPSIYYLGFNMLDNIVGGNSERARKLRQAIAIALDYEEFISIFLNGRGIPAQGLLPPGIFGYVPGKAGVNPYVYRWLHGRAQRKSIDEAKKLLAQAGYPNGINPKTGKPLILHYDAVITGDPNEKARFAWMRKQLAKLGIQLDVRATQYNRFQQKIRTGNTQLFSWGWHADYPDPENFLFLLYGPNSKVKHGGENHTNYYNKEYDKLFDQMKNMPNNPERAQLIQRMMAIIQRDTPLVWGYHPKLFQLSHSWNRISKPHGMANNTLKYAKLDPKLRAQLRTTWNKPVWWPVWLLIILCVVALIPVIIKYWYHEYHRK